MRLLLITSVLIASSAIADPVCEKWMRECHRPSYNNYCAGWTDKCVKWYETPTPVAVQRVWVTDGPYKDCYQESDKPTQIICPKGTPR